MKDFRDLHVWQRSHQLVLNVYTASRGFPHEERFGLTQQIRRAAASIPANIAEGCGRAGDAEFARFLQIAMGSASETEYHIILACDLNLLSGSTRTELLSQVQEIKRMLAALVGKVRGDEEANGVNAPKHRISLNE